MPILKDLAQNYTTNYDAAKAGVEAVLRDNDLFQSLTPAQKSILLMELDDHYRREYLESK